ncbi:phage protein [Clostridium sp. BJN0013]|uniref:phage protein n=1 Tax=Clostridium sp. BJN0013 TaxID=3236840 RepID=UPI0034C67029
MALTFNTYSFQDVTVTFDHTYGKRSSVGAGLGSITVGMTQTKTVQEVGADGVVMVSKVLGENGTITITVQQTSQLHKYLINWYNYINDSSIPTNEWASMTITIMSPTMGDVITAYGVSPQKLADRVYQSQGQMYSWSLMAAKIIHE